MFNSVILGEGERKGWVSYAKDQRAEPITRGFAVKRRSETFAWYFLLRFTTFLRMRTRYGDKDKGRRVT